MDWLGLSPWTWFFIFLSTAATVAFLPTIIAVRRGAIDLTAVVIINLIGCITLICWPVALIMALTCPTRPRVR